MKASPSARTANASVSRSSFLTMARTISFSREDGPKRLREDLDSFERRGREACPARRAGDTVAGTRDVAMRAGLPGRPATREPKAHGGGQTQDAHEDPPGHLLAPGTPERAHPPH